MLHYNFLLAFYTINSYFPPITRQDIYQIIEIYPVFNIILNYNTPTNTNNIEIAIIATNIFTELLPFLINE